MPLAKDDYGKLTGSQKAAMLMLALEDRHSRVLFDRMEDEEIRDLSRTMSGLGTVKSATVEQLFVDFSEQLSSAGTLVGSYGTTERLLRRTLSDKRVGHIMEEIRGPAGRTMWDKLGNVNEAVLATYLKNEYPQTVAVVMAKLKPDHAARVLAMLPENFALEVINRMLRMQNVQKDVLDHVERTLRTEFMTNLARTSRHDSHEQMAEIFNNLDRTAESRFMTALEERNREAADRIKRLMFTFDDLARLDSNGVQVLLHQVDKEQLALALKGASDEVRDLFFSNMAERAAKMMREDMEALGAVRVKDVDEAQAVIVVAAKALADAGEIVIAGGGDDELIS